MTSQQALSVQEETGLLQGHADLWPMPVFCVPASKGKKGSGKQNGRSAIAFPFVLTDTALGHCSAPGSPSLQVLSF